MIIGRPHEKHQRIVSGIRHLCFQRGSQSVKSEEIQGRMADGTLYYIVTRHKETMYDFSDAMREYGVVDAIYITGGNSYLFHRDSNGNVCMTDNTRSKISKYSESAPPAPLLVFRKDIR